MSGENTNFQTKEKRIKKEIARLKKVFADVPVKKKDLVSAMIEDVAFMTVTMQDLREIINRNGTTSEYQNGENQWGTKQSPEAQLYLQMSQKQSTAMKILLDCLPKDPPRSKAEASDGFEDFLGARDD